MIVNDDEEDERKREKEHAGTADAGNWLCVLY